MRKIISTIYLVLSIFVATLFVLMAVGRLFRKGFTRGSRIFSLWAGTPIITLSVKAKAEKLLGVEARSLVYKPYYTTSDFDYNLTKWFDFPLIGRMVPFMTFIWACLFADRLHFYCDRGLLPSLRPFTFNPIELRTYRLLGIEVFLWTFGADVRSREITKSLGEPNCCTECKLIGKACICDEKKRQKNLDILGRYSKAIFSMGDMSEYVPGSRSDLFFWPVDLNGPNAGKYEPIYPEPDDSKPFRIVHAPNHRAFKGTHFLVEAVDALKAEGAQVELVLVEKIPNEKALDIYRSADLIFDQCLIGFHGYFAIEAMAMGKPVMCFIRKPKEYLLSHEECPIINTHVDTLKEDILKLIKDRYLLTETGKKSRQYIEKYFTLEAFAQRLTRAYRELGIDI